MVWNHFKVISEQKVHELKALFVITKVLKCDGLHTIAEGPKGETDESHIVLQTTLKVIALSCLILLIE